MIRITEDKRRPDGTGWQIGEFNGWHLAREFAREIVAYDPDTGPTFAPGKAKPGAWQYYVTGFSDRSDWPTHPDYDGNVGHVLRADGTEQPVRMYGRKLFVTKGGTTSWKH